MENNVEEFANFLLMKGLADRTIEEYLRYYSLFPRRNPDVKSAMMRFLNLYNNGVARSFVAVYFEFLDITDIKIPKRTGRRKRRKVNPLNEFELEKLRRALYYKNEKFGIMFDIQYECGLRRNELVEVKIQDIGIDDWIENSSEPARMRVIGKGDKERIVLIPPKIMRKLMEYVEKNHRNIDEEKPLFQVGGHRWWEILNKVSKEVLDSSVYPHLIRHTKATDLHNENFDIVDIKNFLGHSDISTTSLYINPSEEESLEKMRNFILEH